MSSKHLDTPIQRRTSERRRLKMLKKRDEYKISNPYKSQKELPSFPEDLSNQLKKIDFLSATTISLLSFSPNSPRDTSSDRIINKMNEASQGQSDRYAFLFGEGE